MTATPPEPTIRPALPVLTSLRFFAATVVVFRHQAPEIGSDFLRGIATAGYEAVIFFFVLSGFILTYVYSGASRDEPMAKPASEFWWARFVRIAPAYYFGLLLLAPRFFYTALISKIMSIKSLGMGLVLVPLFQQAWWPPAALLWNTPAWSLSVEFFFYAMFPVLAVATARLPLGRFLIGAFALVLLVNLLRFQALPDAPSETALHNFIWFSPLAHLPQFIFGMALGRVFLFSKRASKAASAAMLYGGLLAVILILGVPALSESWLHSKTALVALFGVLIFGGAGAEGAAKPLAAPFLVLLGEASYSIYILHIPVAFWWEWAVAKAPGLLSPWASFAAYFVVITTISIAFFLLAEQPLRKRLRATGPRFWRRPAVATT